VRFLGSYPRAGVALKDVRPLRPGTSDGDFSAASDWLARCQDGRF
jgi:prephenate dehydratase